MKRLGISEAMARDQKAATIHGVMFLQKKINTAQFDAGEEMFALHKSYLKARSVPDSLAVTDSIGGGDHVETETYVEWAGRVTQRHDAAMDAIRSAQQEHRGRNLYGALDYMLYRNEYYLHMEADFSVALRWLAIHFGLTGAAKSVDKDEILRRGISA